MRIITIVFMSMLLVSFKITFGSESANTIVVTPDPKCETLINAFLNVENGGIIKIMPGKYIFSDEALEIQNKKDVTIKGIGNVELIQKSPDYQIVIIRSCMNITFENIRARHLPVAPADISCYGPVLYVVNSKNITIKGCDLNGCGTAGIQAWSCEKLKILGNKIHHNSVRGLDLKNINGIEIVGNKIFNNPVPVYQENVTGLLMK